MKLIKFTHQVGYNFILFFENGESTECDLKNLIGKHVNLQQIKTAHINSDWGCLEFNAGMSDIEPKTLYHYAYGINQKKVA